MSAINRLQQFERHNSDQLRERGARLIFRIRESDEKAALKREIMRRNYAARVLIESGSIEREDHHSIVGNVMPSASIAAMSSRAAIDLRRQSFFRCRPGDRVLTVAEGTKTVERAIKEACAGNWPKCNSHRDQNPNRFVSDGEQKDPFAIARRALDTFEGVLPDEINDAFFTGKIYETRNIPPERKCLEGIKIGDTLVFVAMRTGSPVVVVANITGIQRKEKTRYLTAQKVNTTFSNAFGTPITIFFNGQSFVIKEWSGNQMFEGVQEIKAFKIVRQKQNRY